MIPMNSTDEPLFVARSIKIADGIVIRIPTVREILMGGEQYYSIASMFVATPFDMMVQLDDLGIDFTKISEFELFWFVFLSLQKEQIDNVFVDIIPSDFRLTNNSENGEAHLVNDKTGVKIDQFTAEIIADTMRRIMCVDKNEKKAGNGAAKKFLLQRARRRKQRLEEDGQKAYLEPLIVSMVNAPEFKYDFASCMDLNVYAFNACVKQVQKRINYNQIMSAVYAGTIKSDSIDLNKLNWLS